MILCPYYEEMHPYGDPCCRKDESFLVKCYGKMNDCKKIQDDDGNIIDNVVIRKIADVTLDEIFGKNIR